MRKPDLLQKQAVKQNSLQAWNDYKKARNEVNASIKEARANFFNDSIKKHSGNLKETRKVIISSQGRKPKTTVMKLINSFMRVKILHKSKIYIAEQMNNHFCPLGTKEASGFPDTVLQPEDFLSRTDSYCYFRPVNVGYIHNPISNLKPSVSCRLDNISSTLLSL